MAGSPASLLYCIRISTAKRGDAVVRVCESVWGIYRPPLQLNK